MQEEGTSETVTKLRLVASAGVDRLLMPKVSSSGSFLQLQLRGPSSLDAMGQEILHVTSEPVSVSVLYTCMSDGLADVSLTLEKATLSEGHVPEQMTLRWKKRCGAVAYRHLQVTLKSPRSKNRTEVVTGGLVRPGFARPCTPAKTGGSPASVAPGAEGPRDAAEGSAVATEEACGVPSLEVPAAEARTSLEFRIDRTGQAEPPAFQPAPDLSFDRRILSVKLSQQLRSGGLSGKPGGGRPGNFLQTMSLKYTCFRDGVSVIMLTVHILAHKPIDIAWRKRCVEPKAKVGKALTAPRAMAITLFVCSVIAIIAGFLYWCCSSEQEKPYAYDEVEMPSRRKKNRRAPTPQPLGAGTSDGEDDTPEGQITFHS